ncbi:hypothetical protein IJJ12_02235 [bacterium]|nr:hypothetical protein [bacterium]
MKKIIHTIIIAFIWWTMVAPVSAAGELYLDENFADTDSWLHNWDWVGRLAPGTDDTGRTFLDLKVDADSPLTWISAIRNGDQVLPLPDIVTYVFDFQPRDFAVGDIFELLVTQASPTFYYSFDCQYSSASEITCVPFATDMTTNTHQPTYGRNILITNYHPGDRLRFLINQSSTSGVTAAAWVIGAAFDTFAGRSEADWRGFDQLPCTLPRLILRRSQVSRDTASLRLERFLYASQDYRAGQGVRRWSQTDETWRDQELGHSGQTIGDIGCLLTDLVMILRSYGYDRIDDTTDLTPATLNAWLTAQPDGYINQNLLNIAAVMRLGNRLHEYYGHHLPKLEYSVQNIDHSLPYTAEATMRTIQDLLLDLKPLILEMTGHFIVSDKIALTAPHGHFFIKDPICATCTSLGDYNGDWPRSLRIFTPSYTDQSYIILNVIGQVGVDMPEATNSVIVDLRDPVTDQLLGYQYLIPKPASGQYTITARPFEENSDISLFIYNQAAEVAVFTLDDAQLTDAGYIWDVTYQKDATANFATVPPVADSWDRLWLSPAWEWQFVKLSLQQLAARNYWTKLSWYANDFYQRGYLSERLWQRLGQLLDKSDDQ